MTTVNSIDYHCGVIYYTAFLLDEVGMVRRIDVTLEQHEYSALLEMAVEDLRNPSDQLRHILRMEIDRRMDKIEHLNLGQDENSVKKKNEISND
ncbi:MAG TPA: hypothetical protein PLE10_03195 [Brevefilum sp.]|nr:hypothetical protein [Brevefilum sp.]HPL69718.1 hypothetical protein [Brevefilum sp.]